MPRTGSRDFGKRSRGVCLPDPGALGQIVSVVSLRMAVHADRDSGAGLGGNRDTLDHPQPARIESAPPTADHAAYERRGPLQSGAIPIRCARVLFLRRSAGNSSGNGAIYLNATTAPIGFGH